MGGTHRAEPVLRVERGTASQEELAALVLVLLARRGRSAAGVVRPRRTAVPRWWQRPGEPQGPHGRR
ncbi:acyl-CoA carboxylase epsilon subunit [Streptomyces sp. NPDC058751]|uniref:acyl-CoA carboxylase epsilon subunit n=1 Tax=Streptomyces sp. NPDC058751 TaxID=3346623 RepID=UPI0036974F17